MVKDKRSSHRLTVTERYTRIIRSPFFRVHNTTRIINMKLLIRGLLSLILHLGDLTVLVR
jgi:hypothetical protein